MPKNKMTIRQNRRTEISHLAENHLEEIWLYINAENSQAAENLIKEFSRKFKMLAENPNLGKLRDELFLNLRSFPLKKYIIFYFPIENGIEI